MLARRDSAVFVVAGVCLRGHVVCVLPTTTAASSAVVLTVTLGSSTLWKTYPLDDALRKWQHPPISPQLCPAWSHPQCLMKTQFTVHTDDQAANLTRNKNGPRQAAESASVVAPVEVLARSVLQRCLALGSRDNMTIVLADLRPPKPPPEAGRVDEILTPDGGHEIEAPRERGVDDRGGHGREDSGIARNGVVSGVVVDPGRGDARCAPGVCSTAGVDEGTYLSQVRRGTGRYVGEAAAWEQALVEVGEGGGEVCVKLEQGVHDGEGESLTTAKDVDMLGNMGDMGMAIAIGEVAPAVAEKPDANLAIGGEKSATGVVGGVANTRQGDAGGAGVTHASEYKGREFLPPEGVEGVSEKLASAE